MDSLISMDGQRGPSLKKLLKFDAVKGFLLWHASSPYLP